MFDLILGAGQIGEGLGAVLESKHRVQYHDPGKGIFYVAPQLLFEVDYLHVCIPGTIPDFLEQVVKAVKEFNPKIVVLHSTVVPGTTRLIASKICVPIVHSPIRGKHPHLDIGVATYLKHIGYIDRTAALQVAEHFEEAGIAAEIYDRPETTELGKILELFRYGMEVMMITKQAELCKSYHVDFESTIAEFIKSYNIGLCQLDLGTLAQPLPTPMEGNKLGGHCVIENCWELFKALPEAEGDFKRYLIDLVNFGKGDRKLK
jgi:UDP-N-acetyl-D-mannosaminuronate dehydrogenase